MHTPVPPYRALLDYAYRTGEADGMLAGQCQLPERPPAVGSCFHGRDADRFAEWLWRPRPGPPPSGLIANAGLWYLAGFRDGFRGSRAGTSSEGDGAWVAAGREESPKSAMFSVPDGFAVGDTRGTGRPAIPRPRAAARSSVPFRRLTAVDRSEDAAGPGLPA